jgi:hypothetical protein
MLWNAWLAGNGELSGLVSKVLVVCRQTRPTVVRDNTGVENGT